VSATGIVRKSALAQSGARLVLILVPYVWMVASVLVPFLIILKISLSYRSDRPPGYVPALDLTAGWAGIESFVSQLTFESYAHIASDSIYLWSYLGSLRIAAISTLILLVIGYPFAYGITRLPRWLQPLFVMLVVLPFLTSSLIRAYAWGTILRRQGVLDHVLISVGAIARPLGLGSSDLGLYIGMTYTYLPFMVLPLYATLWNMDRSLLEAAANLGCPPGKAFWVITLPLSRPAIWAGSLLCFVPMTGEYVVPQLLGSTNTTMIAQILWGSFSTHDWPVSSAIAVVLLLLLAVPIAVYQRVQARATVVGS